MISIDAQPQDDPNAPWLDMIFEVASFIDKGDMYAVQLVALHGDVRVGFACSVPQRWESIFDSDGEPTRQPSAQILTMTATQDSPALAQYLNHWSELEIDAEDVDYFSEELPRPNYPKGQIPLNAVYLGEEDKTIEHGLTRLKLFHEFEPYFEAFLTLDLDAGHAALNEKDMDYRNAFRSVLTTNFRHDG